MKQYPLCDPYVWENPKVMLYTGFTLKSHPAGPCVSERVNHIIFVYLIAFALGGAFLMVAGGSYTMPAALVLATLYVSPTLLELMRTKREVEGFQAEDRESARRELELENTPTITRGGDEATEVYQVIGAPGTSAAPATLTLPTARNPFMNVLLDEIKYHPTRPMAASVMDPSVRVTLDDFFRSDFYADPTDVFGKTQSQRTFITMPSTSIPNDRDSYQNWLYRIPGKTCKEGGREACLPGTDGGVLPWLNSNP